MDFSIKKYEALLSSLINSNVPFQTLDEFLRSAQKRAVILRHDVDIRPENSLLFAKLQHQAGVAGVYYFRAVPQSWDDRIIRQIADMGHEIGYHYECLTTCHGNLELAIRDFENNLTALRRLAPVTTICMHGSPLSKHDSRDLWKAYSYRDFGLIGEPYFDIDFRQVAYLTDTGRQWDGRKVSVRDKVPTSAGPSFKTTDSIIAAVEQGSLPDQIMFTFHPQRWTDHLLPWVKELAFQQVKNMVKRYFYVRT
jgi:hypothetical protein